MSRHFPAGWALQFPFPVLHTSDVHGLRRLLALAGLLVAQAICRPSPTSTWQAAILPAAHANPDARILVVDIASGRTLASARLAESERTLAAPGSTLKPLILYRLLASSHWDPARRIACDGNLTIAGHRLACSHPPAPPFNAREALAWSCNTYFAQVARSIPPGELRSLLQPTGLLGPTNLGQRNGVAQTLAELHEPAKPESMELAVLGIEGLRVTPLELAAAYRWLALEIAAHPGSAASEEVRNGLTDSSNFGIASAASLGGVSIAGKTGTAEGIRTAQTHGWFAGLSPAERPRFVIVVYLPSGHGADAARVAANLLAHARGARP